MEIVGYDTVGEGILDDVFSFELGPGKPLAVVGYDFKHIAVLFAPWAQVASNANNVCVSAWIALPSGVKYCCPTE
ncbi:unnamed protein product, partial [marine sediment metagenome]